MKKPTKILVPVDFTDLSMPALDYACMLAGAFGAHVEVVHVVDSPVYLPTSYGEPSSVPASAEDLDRWVEEGLATARKRAPDGVRVGARRVDGDPAQQILRLVDEEAFDLVTMSTHGRTGLQRMLLGSTAETVVRYASCPVLCLKQGAEGAAGDD